jgi:hypothetical protein
MIEAVIAEEIATASSTTTVIAVMGVETVLKTILQSGGFLKC